MSFTMRQKSAEYDGRSPTFESVKHGPKA